MAAAVSAAAKAFAKAERGAAAGPAGAAKKPTDWAALQEAMAAAAAKAVASLAGDAGKASGSKAAAPGGAKPGEPGAAGAATKAWLQQAKTKTDAALEAAGKEKLLLPPSPPSSRAEPSAPAAALPVAPAMSAAVSVVAAPAQTVAASAPKAAGPAGGASGAGLREAVAAAAAKREAAHSLKRNARVSYIGRPHPSVAASQERYDAFQSAISRIEAQVCVVAGRLAAGGVFGPLLVPRHCLCCLGHRLLVYACLAWDPPAHLLARSLCGGPRCCRAAGPRACASTCLRS